MSSFALHTDDSHIRGYMQDKSVHERKLDFVIKAVYRNLPPVHVRITSTGERVAYVQQSKTIRGCSWTMYLANDKKIFKHITLCKSDDFAQDCTYEELEDFILQKFNELGQFYKLYVNLDALFKK